MKKSIVTLLTGLMVVSIILVGCAQTPTPEAPMLPQPVEPQPAPPEQPPEVSEPPTPAPTPTPTSPPTPTPTQALQYTLSTSVSPLGSGTVSPTSGSYDSGTKVALTASPASGYTFDHWSGDSTGTSISITVMMDADKSITANFKDLMAEGILFEDFFEDNRNDWEGTIEDNALHIYDYAQEGWQTTRKKWKWPPAAPDFSNFGYEVEVISIEANGGWPRGLIFLCANGHEAEESLQYLFVINGQGDYALVREEDKELHFIIGWTGSRHIREGNVSNTLKVICRDSIIELYANDNLLKKVSGEFPDDIGDNGIGLMVYASGGDVHIAFDNLKMWIVPQ